MPSDLDLIRSAQAGDGAAFDALVGPHLARAYRVASLITQESEGAVDALQEALFRAYRALGRFSPDRPFYPWFSRIVVNEAIKQGQRQRRSSFLPMPELVDPETPEGLLMRQEAASLVWQAISRLSPDHRAVIVLRYYEGLREAEMAAVLGVRIGTVKSRLYRARRLLAGKLRPTLAAQEV